MRSPSGVVTFARISSSFAAVAAGSESGLAPITVSMSGQAAASEPASGPAGAAALVVAAADVDEAVVDVDEPPQPDSAAARAARAIGATSRAGSCLGMGASSGRWSGES